MDVTIRTYRPDDFEKYLHLCSETEQLDRSAPHVSCRGLREWLGRPNYAPGRDLFVAEQSRKIVGYVGVTLELAIGRAVLDCLVHPRHRRKGLATQLITRASERAEQSGARVIQCSIPETHGGAKRLGTRLGFLCVRRFLEMKLDLDTALLPSPRPHPFSLRGLRHGEEKLLTQIQNRAFTGTWGFHPNTTEEIAYRLRCSGCSPDHVMLAFSEEEPVAYCWTRLMDEEDPRRRRRRGQIHMLGVDPGYRGKGLGKTILVVGLHHLAKQGVEVVDLTVDSGNQAACAVYKSARFRVWSNTLWYEKELS